MKIDLSIDELATIIDALNTDIRESRDNVRAWKGRDREAHYQRFVVQSEAIRDRLLKKYEKLEEDGGEG